MLSKNDEYALSTLESIDVKSDKDNCKTFLVKDAIDGDLYIKRVFANKTSLAVYRALVGIKHKNLPEVFKVVESESSFIVVEEYIHGETLQEKLPGNKPLPENQVLDYAIQLCEVLELLHGMNPPVIHRDIKPSNIVCSNDGVIKLIDFDAAKEYNASSAQDTMTLGTKVYAAPEQFGYAKADEKTDIYCLGATMFQLLAGILYIPKQNMGVYDSKMTSVIRKCVQIDPDNRYRTVSHLRSDLEDIRSGKRRGATMFPDLQNASPNKKAALTALFTIIVFVVLGLSIIGAATIEGNVFDKTDTLLFLVCSLVIPCALILNFYGIRSKLPFFKRKTLIGNIIGTVFVIVVLVLIFLLAFTLIEALRTALT